MLLSYGCYYRLQVICTCKFGRVTSGVVSLCDHKGDIFRRYEIMWSGAGTEGKTLLSWRQQPLTLWHAGEQLAVLQDDRVLEGWQVE